MSSKESRSSYESDAWENGEFTRYFVDLGMVQGEADATPHDGIVTIEEAFDYAKANCQYDTPVINDQFQDDMQL